MLNSIFLSISAFFFATALLVCVPVIGVNNIVIAQESKDEEKSCEEEKKDLVINKLLK